MPAVHILAPGGHDAWDDIGHSRAGRQRRFAAPSPTAAVIDRRARRVTLLVLGMTCLSLADLALTLAHMRSFGMFEVNPVARAMLAIGGVDQLVRYKLFTIAVSGGILYLLRRDRRAEICAWICCAALAGLSLHWGRYSTHVGEFAQLVSQHTPPTDARWIRIEN